MLKAYLQVLLHLASSFTSEMLAVLMILPRHFPGAERRYLEHQNEVQLLTVADMERVV